uniref:Putative molecular chaperone dnaj superfamily n=1 Tax=Corethrella appendiculata TaxID=1370023 RepID=U5EWB7_9DIPT
MDDSEDLEYNEEDYYTFLNLSKDASSEEINTAYRNFSRIYHPDKHTDVSQKQKAEILFNRVKKAYEVLSDPHQRAIYDNLGKKGLEIEGWEIVHKTKTPAEIREEYERLAKEREERRLQQKTNPRGNITVQINATDIFSSYEDEFNEKVFPTIEVSGMSMSQSIEAPLTRTDTGTLSGNLNLSNGVGSGGFTFSGRRLVNKGWFEVDAGAGNGPVLGIKSARNLSNRIFCNGGVTVNYRQHTILPGLVGTLAVQLDRHTVGYLTYNAGIQSSMSTVVEHNDEKQHYNINATLGIPHCYISAVYIRKFVEQEMKLRLAVKAGTFGYTGEYGVEKKVSKYSSVVATVSIGVPTGVILKIKIIRSSQTYLFPIHLSEEIIPAAIFYSTVTPLIAYFVIKKIIIEPMNAEQKQRNIDKVKEQNKVRLAEKRKEAESAISLMSALYKRILGEEQKKNGLIIIRAFYGKFDNDDDASAVIEDEMGFLENNPNIIDVKIPLQCLTKDSCLILQSSSKYELPGFYDTCVGEEKHLKIDYRYQNSSYSIIVNDKDSVRLPQIGNSTT